MTPDEPNGRAVVEPLLLNLAQTRVVAERLAARLKGA